MVRKEESAIRLADYRDHEAQRKELPAGLRAVAFFRGWDEFQPGVIDSDLSPQFKADFHPRNYNDIFEEVQRVQRQQRREVPNPDLLSSEYTLAMKLHAAYVSILAQMHDTRIELRDYVKAIQGIDIAVYDERVVEVTRVVRDKVAGFLRTNGYGSNYAEAARVYKEKNAITPEQFVEEYLDTRARHIPRLSEYLGIDIRITAEPELIDSDDTWTMDTTKNGGVLKQQINTNAPMMVKGFGEALEHHEDTHAVNFDIVEQRIAHGELNAGIGTTTLREQRLYASEGLANTLHRIVPPEVSALSSEAVFAFDVKYLRSLTYYQAQRMMNSYGYAWDNIVRFVTRTFPFDDEAIIHRDLEKRKGYTNSAYNLVYPAAEMDFRDVARKLRGQDEERRREYVLSQLQGFYTPDQTAQLWQEAIRTELPELPSARVNILYAGPPRTLAV